MSESFAIIKHQVFRQITDEEVLQLLPHKEGIPVYEIFDIKREIISMEEIHKLDSFEFRIYQKNVVENEIKPFISSHPGCRILYFGTASIPLALHLGYCFGGWQEIDVYLLHREKMTWKWENHDERKELPFSSNYVKEEFSGPIDVIFKVETTYPIQDVEVKAVVENHSKIISLKPETIGKDIFRNQDQLKAFAHQFSLGIDSVANLLPNADKIHLFPSVPVGLAFLIGTKINPLVTKPIVTYQYDINHDPKYHQVLILQEAVQHEINIKEDDQKFIDEFKKELQITLETSLPSFIQSKITSQKNWQKKSWIRVLFSKGEFSEIQSGYWKSIPSIADTVLISSTLTHDTSSNYDGFRISERNEWQISDRFIFNIAKRLEFNKVLVLRALRLFIFHESLHQYQRLTNYTATSIGRFPRVLEEADYVADVWAMINEYAYSEVNYPDEARDLKSFFLNLIDVANKTMWAFDDLDLNNEEMQIRRVNRYLIWYWNYLRIEDRNSKTIEDIVNILGLKPWIEIKGLDIRAQTQRTIFKLSNFKNEELEIGYLTPSGKIIRISNSAGLKIDDLIRGFRERNGTTILEQLKSMYDQVRDQ